MGAVIMEWSAYLRGIDRLHIHLQLAIHLYPPCCDVLFDFAVRPNPMPSLCALWSLPVIQDKTKINTKRNSIVDGLICVHSIIIDVYLSHRCEETLGIEKSSHPKYLLQKRWMALFVWIFTLYTILTLGRSVWNHVRNC